MTVLTWMFAVPLIGWMAAAGLGALTGHKIAAETFDRLGYSSTDLQAITGSYVGIVATLASLGDVLRAGDVIITGSVAPPDTRDRGQRLRVRPGSIRPHLLGHGIASQLPESSFDSSVVRHECWAVAAERTVSPSC